MTTDNRKIVYKPIRDLVPNPHNPKDHDIELIEQSMSRFGFIEPVVLDERTGQIISGHGRTETLAGMERAKHDKPAGVKANKQGHWLVPVVAGWASADDLEAKGALIALNRATEAGGWDDQALLGLLQDLGEAEEGYTGVGYSSEDMSELQSGLDKLSDAEQTDADEYEDDTQQEKYTRHMSIPQYIPKDEPVELAELVEHERYDELVADIEASEIPSDVADFLILAATRHLRFDYAKIADYYAAAPAEVQDLMERSALVILDPNDAIRLGYLKLSGRMAELLGENLQTLADAERSAK